MIVAIHQPQFFPWIGYFYKIAACDLFIYLDDVQFKKNEFQNRNKIKTAQGPRWLTVPVRYSFGQSMREVETDNRRNWRHAHLQTLRTNYAPAPWFQEYFPRLEALYAREWDNIAEFNIATVNLMMEFLGLKVERRRSSELPSKGASTQRLVSLCSGLGAQTYLSGAGARDYLDASLFAQAGIALRYQEFEHPEYPQLFGDFEPFLSCLDWVLNTGEAAASALAAFQSSCR